MWTSLGITALFVLLLLIWWGVLTEGGGHAKYARTAPIGVVCITAVFISMMFFHYKF